MIELKFPCPTCGQNILCDTTHAGTQIVCPGCSATITVPKEIAVATDAAIQAGNPPPLAGNMATTTQRNSGLAIASLVCSLSSLITCVGWLPGIICGHLAKSRIRRNPSLKGGGLATAGLTIGYLILMLEIGTATVHVWRFSTAVKHGFENAAHNLATNNLIITQTQSITASNTDESKEPVQTGVLVTNNQQIEPTQLGWTTDINKVSIPDDPISGKLHGIDFSATTVSFRNGDLKIKSPTGIQLDILRLGASIEGRTYEVQIDDSDNTNPRIKMTWNEGEVIQTATFNKGYGMKLQFDQAINRKISGKIYLCFSDDSKSYVAGTFEMRAPKQK